MIACPRCKEIGSMIDKAVHPSLLWIEYYCNVCGYSWKVMHEKENKK